VDVEGRDCKLCIVDGVVMRLREVLGHADGAGVRCICRGVDTDGQEIVPRLDMRDELMLLDMAEDLPDMDRMGWGERVGVLGRLMEREGILRPAMGDGRVPGAERADGAGRLAAAQARLPRSPMTTTINCQELRLDLCRNIAGLLSSHPALHGESAVG
jgi:hypothetical protein